jgi:hypothetical protein
VEGRTVSADRRQLFLASCMMLFVELVLIRWLGAHVAHLSFFSNFDSSARSSAGSTRRVRRPT